MPSSGLDHARRWYAVFTCPRHEQSVANRLESKLLETFCPTFERESRRQDRRAQVQEPIFPGYLFTRIDLKDRNSVLSVPGVVRLLSFNGKPVPIDDLEIEGMQLCRDRGLALEPHPFLAIGERVRVTSGALEGLEGVVTHRKNGCRLVISITQLHQAVAVQIDASLLAPI